MRYRFQSGEKVYEIFIERQGLEYRAVVDGQPYTVEVVDSQPGQINLRIPDSGGSTSRLITLFWVDDGSTKWISLNGCTYRLEKPTRRQARQQGEVEGSEAVRAPMPAQVRAVQVAEGEMVEKGQTLLLLEAMKMEIRIKAPAGGLVERLLVSDGQSVEKEQILAEIIPVSGV
jgi:acetyl/propionyl-CoA carboxylase alpha subunit